jgi:ubiquinone/menaquinone biosynthesis C-methylase UbiE
MLNQARKVCHNTTFLKIDLEKEFPNFNTKFDLITCKLVLMYLSNIENLAKETYKILNKNGILVVSVTHPMKWMDKTSYLKEDIVPGEIANDRNLKVTFKSRTIQTYINTFTKYGFRLEVVLETGVPDSFVVKYPHYLAFQKKPYRLNLKFVKKS